MAGLNKNNSAVRRIMSEAKELSLDPSTDYTAGPLEDDIFEWHCTIRGPPATEFEGGLYHFRIILPAEYPFKAPSIMCLTPNGRFETNTKICISFTSYHEDQWQPAWGVRTAIIGVQGFFPLRGEAAAGIGSIEAPLNERKRLAALSQAWTCSHCQESNLELLPHPHTPSASPNVSGGNEEPAPAPIPTPQITPVVPKPPESERPSEAAENIHSQPIPATAHTSVASHGHTRLAVVDTAIFVLLGLASALLLRRLL